ncbi:MAG: M20/M25/M40 family metallo-hydrolase [Acidobacteria bacterium]|nr:M20/M25/M40 family metallo-hydrolase [Acidobacteriota bacterium]
MHLQEPRLRQWHRALMEIPAPPFSEEARARWMLERMRELGLAATSIDREGNAIGYLREPVAGEPLVLLSAHIDTVFPAGTPLNITEEDALLTGPGACDNAAGVTALLAIAAALRHANVETGANILFAANVGEEAEGNLRGMRYLLLPAHGRRIAFAVALEGSGNETVVTRALGSRRFRVTLQGPGGHAWSDASLPNPAAVMAQAITTLYACDWPAYPRTTINVGALESGGSVTAIPESATALFDLRSVDATELLRAEVALFRAVEDAVIAANVKYDKPLLRSTIESIGERPAAELADDSPLLAIVRSVDRHLAMRTSECTASTDANLPLSLGVQAIAIGAGGRSGGIHTTHEWYDATGRELALRRVLLVLLDCCDLAVEAEAL